MFKNSKLYLKLFLVVSILSLNLKILTIKNFTDNSINAHNTQIYNFTLGNLAVVRVPVADLLWESAQDLAHGLTGIKDPLAIYRNLGLGDMNCLRAYQLLLHETVLVLEERGAEVKIAVPHIFYLTGSKSEPAHRGCKNLSQLENKHSSPNVPEREFNTSLDTNLDSRSDNNLIINLANLDQEYSNSFWTLKANLVPVESLSNLGLNLSQLPVPINFNNFKELDLGVFNFKTVTLVKPVINLVTKQSYSVGTRFVLAEKSVSAHNIPPSTNAPGFVKTTPGLHRGERDSGRAGEELFKLVDVDLSERSSNLNLPVWVLDNSNNNPRLTQIVLPVDSYLTYIPKSFTEQKQDFVNLVKSWANLNTGFVPYVYSGASLTSTCAAGQCLAQSTQNILGQPAYIRENYTHEPSTGLDCSCLVSRAAQAVGISYFYKNSATIERNLVEIRDLAELTDGDLLWHRGHIMIVSDVKQGLMVEARGYRQGFGCLHEIPLSKIFYGINSYAELLNSIKNNLAVRTLDHQGNFFGQIARFKLLKLAPDHRL